MNFIKRLLPYLKPQMPTLALAYACMVVLGVTTAFYAFLAGPALKFVFTGNITDVLRSSTGEIRSVWTWMPDGWIGNIENLDRTSALLTMQCAAMQSPGHAAADGKSAQLRNQ